MYLFQKNQQFVFSSFFTTTSIRGDFWPICHLTPTPWVTPPGQPLTYLPLCFLCPTSPKKMLDHENLTAFAIFQSGGWVFNFGLFGLFWPTLSEPCSPRVAQKCPTMVSPCYTHGTPCPNIRRACSINFVQFLNTPTRHCVRPRKKVYTHLHTLISWSSLLRIEKNIWDSESASNFLAIYASLVLLAQTV